MVNGVLTLSKTYLKQFSGLENQVWHGIFVNLVESILLGIFYFLPVYFIQVLNFSVVNAGLIISFFGIGTILGGALGGIFSDLFSSTRVCLVSLFCQAIVFFILINLTSKWALCANIFGMGFFSYTYLTANHLWVLERSGSLKLKALNILNVVSNIGLALSAILIGFLFEHSFRVTFAICGLFLVLLTFYFSIIQIKINNPQKINNSSEHAIKKIGFNLKILVVLLCTGLIGFIIFQINTTYSQFLLERFPVLGLKALSILFAINCLMVVFMQSPLTNFFSKNNQLIVIGVGAFLVGFGMFILNYSYSFIMAVISCAVYTIGEMLFCPFSQIICYEAGSVDRKGSLMGIYRTIYATSRVSAPIIGTGIYQYFGSYVLWYFCGILGTFSFLICWIFRRL